MLRVLWVWWLSERDITAPARILAPALELADSECVFLLAARARGALEYEFNTILMGGCKLSRDGLPACHVRTLHVPFE